MSGTWVKSTGGGRALRIERLEEKMLLAGDVHVVVSGGDLRITGDDSGNDIEIVSTGNDGQYLVRGLFRDGADTTINNGMNTTTVDGVDDDFRIDMRDGDNRIALLESEHEDQLLVPDDLNIRNGDGQIEVKTVNVRVGDDLWIHTHDGSDVILLQGTQVDDKTTLELGGGKNSVTIESTLENVSTFGNDLDIDADDGPDDIVMRGARIGDDLDLHLGGGDNSVGLDDTITRNDIHIHTQGGADHIDMRGNTRAINDARLELGEGENSLVLEDVFVEDDLYIVGGHAQAGDDIQIKNTIVLDLIDIAAHAGDDTVRMTNVKPRRMHVHMDRGDDRLELLSVKVSYQTRLRGDGGTDTLARNDDNTLPRLSVRTFEEFDELVI